MKRIIALAPALLLAALCACSRPGAQSSAAPSATPIAPSASVSAAPSGFALSANVPDVDLSSGAAAINSGFTLYEDSDSVYFLSPWHTGASSADTNRLYRIAKADGSAAAIAQDVSCLTLSGGKIYYASGVAVDYVLTCNTVFCYDPATAAVTQLFATDQNIYRIAIYGDQVYYAADAYPTIGDGFDSDLFRCALDGTGETMLADLADIFCIDSETIYYTSGNYDNGTPVFACALDGGSPHTVAEKAASESFAVRGSMLYYLTGEGLAMQNLTTGAAVTLPGYYDFALLGQYLLAQGDTLDAYDTDTGVTYRLAALDTFWDSGWTYLHAGDLCAYFSAEADDGSFSLYRLDIANGSASLRAFAQASG